MDSTSSELRAFNAAARLGSMSAAARELALTQPTVSAHVAALERRFGVELFFRKGRRIELTEFGASLHETTHRMFSAEHDAVALLHQARSEYCGRLRICAVGPYNVTPLILQYRARWPRVEIAVSISDSAEIVRRVLDHQGDIGIPVQPVSDLRLHCEPYRRQALVVFGPRDHPLLAQEGGLALEDLQGQQFVLREQGSSTRRVFEDTLDRAGVAVRCAVEMGSREAVREAVAQGLGLGVVAEFAYVADPRLAVLPIRHEALYTHPHLICLKDRLSTRLIANFVSVFTAERAGFNRAA
ncbi:LysR substrate-binding domain-containing protein [Methylibium sp.]|uniref:LysR substrate-binding domain-containing protein n=1 Tax=Methylibium sp. TaxID=2067992 RepID=UPI001805869C|nr:LysR substrate-binding domain-containing protein [Methylibium sp.]MBA3589945.1 LysR family transcriptional regulator [Methylibium sp.]